MPQKCCLCKSSLNSQEKKVVIKGKLGKSLTVCSSCQDDVYLDGIRFNEDIMIVPVKEDSLNMALTQKLYICPNEYVARKPKMIAFYVGGEVGAITHISCIRFIERKVPKESTFISSRQAKVPMSETAPIWKTFEKYKVFHLENLIELEKRIRRGDARGAIIQKRIYATFQCFLNAKTVRDLFRKK